jgi:DNA-binding response OmpR family regulator
MNTSNAVSIEGKRRVGTVLVVDDDPMIREMEAELLSQEGYQVLQAERPSEALWFARTISVNLLVTDFAMPEINGLELIRRFRSEHPETPVLMVSGSLPAHLDRTGDFEQFEVLEKPFVFVELLNKVRAMLSAALRLPLRTGSAA